MQNEKKSINESLLQSYRSNMLITQSILLAVAAMFYEKNDILEIACVCIALFQLWYIWFGVIRARAIIVDYYKHNLGEKYINEGGEEENAAKPLKLDDYLKKRDIRKKVNEQLAVEKKDPLVKYNYGLTRIKLDIIIPVLFTIMWILLLLDKII